MRTLMTIYKSGYVDIGFEIFIIKKAIIYSGNWDS